MAFRSANLDKPGGLEVERRASRDALEVGIPFMVSAAGRTFPGVRLSLRQVTVRTETAPSLDVELDATLQVTLDGFELTMPLRVAPARIAGPAPGEWRLEIRDMPPRTEAALTQLVRSSLLGWMPNASDLASGWDEETPRHGPATKRPRRTGGHWVALFAGMLVAITGLVLAGQQAYLRVATIPLESAAVSAQRLDILSPEFGEIAPGGVGAGMRVEPGDPLIRISSETLAAAIDIEQLTPAENPESAETRPSTRLGALMRRLGALSFNSACTCTVLWAASPGVSVAPGALLMSLVVSDPSEIRVEAWIPPRLAPDIHPGQKASVQLSGDSRTFSATVEAITYDATPIAKVGLGARDDMATVSLKLDDIDAGFVPGRPATGVIFK
jgi:hypothetical protein